MLRADGQQEVDVPIVRDAAMSVARLDEDGVVEQLNGQPNGTGPEPPEADGVRAFLYDGDGDDRQLRLGDIHVDRLGEDQLLWIDVSDLDSIEWATNRLGLTLGSLARLMNGPTRPEVIFEESYFHVIVILVHRNLFGYEPAALHCIVGENWILTVHDKPTDVLDGFDERIRGDSPLGHLDAPALLVTFLQEHVTSYLREAEPFEVELDNLDLQVMEGRADDEAVFKELVALRRRISLLRRLLAPHSELYALLARPDFEMLSGSDSMEAFAHLDERINQALQRLETTREMVVSSFEIYTTWTAHGTNKVMKLLTVSSVALLPPTLLASVMGMNSLPHSLVVPSAFVITLAAQLILLATVVVGARRRGWL
jgi:magnesium transporter